MQQIVPLINCFHQEKIMVSLFPLVLILSSSVTGKGVTNFRGSRVVSKLSLENFAGNLSRIN